jgi:integrase
VTGPVEKRCTCPEAKWFKCPDPWYLKTITVQGKEFAPNLTRYAARVLSTAITTKTEAEAVAVTVRARILAGTYVAAKHVAPPAPLAPPMAADRTLSAIVALFDAATIDADTTKRRNSKTNDRAGLAELCATRTLGTRPMASITIKDLIAWRGAISHLAASTWNKRRTLVGQVWRWAARHGHVPADIVATAHPDDLKLLRRDTARQRARVITPEVLEALLAAPGAWRGDDRSRMRALIIAAIETGCRLGELLALRWLDVVWTPGARKILIRAEAVGASKSGRSREIDMSAPLADLLEGLQTDPAGQRHKPTAYVFGDAVGGRVRSMWRAWDTTVLRAHGVTPQWDTHGNLAAASRAALRRIDLHFHDLRHHAASEWLASKAFDLKQVSERLGHAHITTTATYLHTTSDSMRASQAAFDAFRRQQAHLSQTAAAGRLKPGARGDKGGTNPKQARMPASGPHLVKGRK